MPNAVSRSLRAAARALLPGPLYGTLTRWYWRSKPSPLDRYRRLRPVSPPFGRGLPLDRAYIEEFLDEFRADVRGRVLEVAGRGYTQRFGQARVTRSDILHVQPEADGAAAADTTIVGDLASGRGIPGGAFDCLILTQTLQMIYELGPAVAHAHAALAPGGVLLATFPGIAQISRYDMERWGDCWRFTDLAVRKLFAAHFPSPRLEVRSYGNVLAAAAYLHGLGADELSPRERAFHDPDYQLIVAVRAVRVQQLPSP